MDVFFQTNGEYYIYALFFVGFITGLVGAMGGSGGLILLPFMIVSGMPPTLALGTARLAAIGAWIVAFSKFNKAQQIRWKELPLITALAVAGGVIGTYLIIDIDEKYVYPVVGSLLVAIAPLALCQKEFGLLAKEHGIARTRAGYGFYFLVLIYGGFFGAGSSILSIFVLVSFLGFRMLEAHATDITAWIIMSFISSAIFIYHDQVNYFFALIIFVSMVLGSFIGSHIAVKKGDRWIKFVVCSFAFIMGVKLLFFT